MSISIQGKLINAGLRYFVKPVLSRTRLSAAIMNFTKSGFDIMSGITLPIPSMVEPERVNVDGVPGEWIDVGAGINKSRVMLYLHGGGYFFGSAHSHRPLIWRFSAQGALRVLALNYRQLPDFPYPAPLEDSITAYRWLLKQGYRPENIVIGGDSAGGNLTLVTLQKIREQGLPMPSCSILLSPWTDLTCSGNSIERNAYKDPMVPSNVLRFLSKYYVGDEDPSDPYLSPVNGNYAGFPPMLLYVGSTEVLLDDARRVADKARQAGVQVEYKEWEQMPHVFPILASFLPEGRIAMRQMICFINTHLGRASAFRPHLVKKTA